MGLADFRRWFGVSGPSVRAQAGGATALAEPPEPVQQPVEAAPPVWTAARIAFEEELWGPGYLTPGGEAELLRYALPLGLSAASSLLLLGAGAGGPAQSLASGLGVWTAAYEADAALASHAAQRIQRAGTALAKRASVAMWDPHAPSFRTGFFHHGLLLDAIRDCVPAPVLAAAAEALKPHGQLVIVETVAPAPLDREDPAILAWCRLEGRQPVLPAPDAVTRALGRLGFDIRVVEDASARHMKLGVLGWKALLRDLGDRRPSPARAAAMVVEAEMWTRRTRLMHDGTIRLMRWHAIHRGPPARQPPGPA